MSYALFKRYARSFDQVLAGDIVHDIYLNYYIKHGRSIFDIPNVRSKKWVYKVVKNHYLNLKHRRLKWIDPAHLVEEGEEIEAVFTKILETSPGIVEEMIGRDILAHHRAKIEAMVKDNKRLRTYYQRRKVTATYMKVYTHMIRGEKLADISAKMKMDYHQVNYYKQHIKRCLR